MPLVGLAAAGDRRLLQLFEARRRRVAFAAQHQADVGMRDETAGAVEHKGIARLPDMDHLDHVPDQLEIDDGNRHAVDLARPGDGDGHMRLGALVQRHRAIPDAVRPGAEHRRIVAAVGAAVDDIGIDPRDVQPLDALAVHERDLDDRGHLTHQPQYVEAVPLVHAVAPRQLHRPLQLVGDVVEEGLDLTGRRARFGVEPLAQHLALVAIPKPRLARPVGEQRHDNRDEQRREILLEQQPPRPGRRPHIERLHPITMAFASCSRQEHALHPRLPACEEIGIEVWMRKITIVFPAESRDPWRHRLELLKQSPSSPTNDRLVRRSDGPRLSPGRRFESWRKGPSFAPSRGRQ